MNAAPFIERYATAFGRRSALLLRLSGLLGAEVRGDGAVVVDSDGRRWFDFGSFGVHLLGHRHPVVVHAARRQIDAMGLSTKILGSAAAIACGEALRDVAPSGVDRVVFANSGAEAVDAALKLAKTSTQRRGIVALRRSYHGKTIGAMSISETTHDASTHTHGDVHFVGSGDTVAVQELVASRTIAAVVVEPVQGEGGIRPVDPAFLRAVGEACRATDTLFVLDEIQTGLGRCGYTWRSAGRHVDPDIVLAGKVLGGGLVPVAAVLFSPRLVPESVPDPVMLASSFAGGALATAVASAVIGIVRDEAFQEHVRVLGAHARDRLAASLRGVPGIADVRGEGLMIGIECATPAIAGEAVLQAIKRGVLLTFCLHDPSVLRVYPPACCTVDVIDEVIDQVTGAVLEAAEIHPVELVP